MGTNWPWNWRLTVPKTGKIMQIYCMTGFKMIVGTVSFHTLKLLFFLFTPWFVFIFQFASMVNYIDWFLKIFYWSIVDHSSVLAWRIPGMAEPGGLLSMGSHRVGHNWNDLIAAAAAAARRRVAHALKSPKLLERFLAKHFYFFKPFILYWGIAD